MYINKLKYMSIFNVNKHKSLNLLFKSDLFLCKIEVKLVKITTKIDKAFNLKKLILYKKCMIKTKSNIEIQLNIKIN